MLHNAIGIVEYVLSAFMSEKAKCVRLLGGRFIDFMSFTRSRTDINPTGLMVNIVE
jgi:hypothetical protein